LVFGLAEGLNFGKFQMKHIDCTHED
jgi:hypothetical protein